MTRCWRLQSQASLSWIWIPASHMNFNDYFCKLFRYASPRSVCMSGYKSAAHTPDSGPSADFSTVTLYGNEMKVIDQAHGPENDTNSQCAPSGTGQNICATAQVTLICFQNTSAITQRIHKGADQFLTRVILPQQALFPCLLLLLCTASLFLSVIFFENMTLERMRHYLQICGHDYSYQKEKKGKSDNSRLCCKVTGMCCTWAIWISFFFFSVDLKFCNNCYHVYLCTRQKKFSCSHGKKVILVNNTRAFHDWQTSTHTPWEVVEVLYISNSTHTHKKRKENAAGMDELHQLPRLRVKMMWFLDWTEKTFSIFGSEVSKLSCHCQMLS